MLKLLNRTLFRSALKFEIPCIGISLVTVTGCTQKNEAEVTRSCSEPNTQDYSQLIQIACSTNSASSVQILTLLMQYVISVATQYKNELNKLTDCIEKNMEILNGHPDQQNIEDRIIMLRNNVQKIKEEYLKVISFLPNAENLINASAEVSYLFGCEQLSTLVSEQLYSVQQKIKNEIECVKEKERENIRIQSQLIERKSNETQGKK